MAERSTGWFAAVGVLVLATVVPLLIAALILSIAEGSLRWLLLVFPAVALVIILPFWPPVLRDDHETVNEMLERRRNS